MAGDTFDRELQNWMKAAQAGDGGAYRKLWEKVRPRPVQSFSSRTGSSFDADELRQTALLRVHLYRHTYDPAMAFELWLFSIARNVFHDHLSRRKRAEELSSDGVDPDTTPAQSQDPVAALAFNEAFEKLNGDQQRLIRLLKVQGLSIEEAAAELGVSPGALKVRIHRACKKFMGLLTPPRGNPSPSRGSQSR